MHYTAIESVVRFLPMSVSGFMCNIIVGLVAAHVPIVWLVGMSRNAEYLFILT